MFLFVKGLHPSQTAKINPSAKSKFYPIVTLFLRKLLMVQLGGRNESSPGVMSAGCLERTPGQHRETPGMHFLFEDILGCLGMQKLRL